MMARQPVQRTSINAKVVGGVRRERDVLKMETYTVETPLITGDFDKFPFATHAPDLRHTGYSETLVQLVYRMLANFHGNRPTPHLLLEHTTRVLPLFDRYTTNGGMYCDRISYGQSTAGLEIPTLPPPLTPYPPVDPKAEPVESQGTIWDEAPSPDSVTAHDIETASDELLFPDHPPQ